MATVNLRYKIYPICYYIDFEKLVSECRSYGAVIPGREEIFQVRDATTTGDNMPRALTLEELRIYWEQHIF